MASAANGQVITTIAVRIFNSATDDGMCTTFYVANRTGSASPVLISIPGLHKPDEYMGIAAGQFVYFQLNKNGLSEVWAKTGSATATIDYGVVTRNSWGF